MATGELNHLSWACSLDSLSDCRLKEACNINSSLLALGKVIHVLSHSPDGQSTHVPYRDSKLTRLLQNAFGGNGKTALICTVSNAEADFRESLSTLEFGNRASRISNSLSRTVTHSVPVYVDGEPKYRDHFADARTC